MITLNQLWDSAGCPLVDRETEVEYKNRKCLERYGECEVLDITTGIGILYVRLDHDQEHEEDE